MQVVLSACVQVVLSAYEVFAVDLHEQVHSLAHVYIYIYIYVYII